MTQTAFLAVAGKDRLCGGLSWLPLVAEERAAQKAEFRRFLREHRSAYGLMVPSTVGQRYAMAGVVVVGQGTRYKHVTGTVAAAQWFAASQTAATLYVERLDNGLYWTLLASGGGVDPRTDRVLKPAALVVLAEELMRDADADQPLAIHCWPGIEAMPDELAYKARLQVSQLDTLLRREARPALKVSKQIGPPTWFIPTVAGATAIAVCGVVGHQAYETFQAQREASRIAAEQAAAEAAAQLDARLALEAEQDRKRASVHDALLSPAPHALIDACVEGLQDLPQSLGGWKLTKVRCSSGEEMSADYARDTRRGGLATQESFAAAAEASGLRYDQGWFANVAKVQGSRLELAERQNSIDSLPATSSAGESLASHAVRVQSLIKTGTFQAGPAQMPSMEDGNNADPGFRIHSVQMGGNGLWTLKAIVPDLQHLKLESIDLSLDTSAKWRWNAIGALYTSSEQS